MKRVRHDQWIFPEVIHRNVSQPVAQRYFSGGRYHTTISQSWHGVQFVQAKLRIAKPVRPASA